MKFSATQTYCNTLQHVSCCIICRRRHPCRYHAATRCNILQHTHAATHCNTLQHTWYYIACVEHFTSQIHFYTLQHTHAATHCKILQDTPMHIVLHYLCVCRVRHQAERGYHSATQCKTLLHAALNCNTHTIIWPVHLLLLLPCRYACGRRVGRECGSR